MTNEEKRLHRAFQEEARRFQQCYRCRVYTAAEEEEIDRLIKLAMRRLARGDIRGFKRITGELRQVPGRLKPEGEKPIAFMVRDQMRKPQELQDMRGWQ